MNGKPRYTRSARGYTVWTNDGTTRLGEVRLESPPGKRDQWTAWYDGSRIGNTVDRGRAVRFTVHNGLKIDAGEGWSATYGRRANETGH